MKPTAVNFYVPIIVGLYLVVFYGEGKYSALTLVQSVYHHKGLDDSYFGC